MFECAFCSCTVVLSSRCGELFGNSVSSPIFLHAFALCHLGANSSRGDLVCWHCLISFDLIQHFLPYLRCRCSAVGEIRWPPSRGSWLVDSYFNYYAKGKTQRWEWLSVWSSSIDYFGRWYTSSSSLSVLLIARAPRHGRGREMLLYSVRSIGSDGVGGISLLFVMSVEVLALFSGIFMPAS